MTSDPSPRLSQTHPDDGMPYAEITDPFRRLYRVMQRLQEPGGCPWDLEQTHQSLRPYLIEEAYEVLEAIDRDDMEELEEELGDVLLQVLFHSVLAARTHGQFSLESISRRTMGKMVRRHPHVFGETQAGTAGEVLQRWEQLKAAERAQKATTKKSAGPLAGVPKQLPALLRAFRIQEKLTRFDDKTPHAALSDAQARVREQAAAWQLASLKTEQSQETDAIEKERLFGELLWALVEAGRLQGVGAEEALRRVCDERTAAVSY